MRITFICYALNLDWKTFLELDKWRFKKYIFWYFWKHITRKVSKWINNVITLRYKNSEMQIFNTYKYRIKYLYDIISVNTSTDKIK